MKSKLKKVGILDYGVGNIASLGGALKMLGFHVSIGKTEASLSKVDALFLPGVGCYPFAMENLRQMKMDQFLKNRFKAKDLNVIGICLGMQILFDYSEEGNSPGLGIMAGQVKRFSAKECHVGWNIVQAKSKTIIADKSAYYFNHSYYIETNEECVLGTSNYQKDFPVIVKKNRFYGVQFHPEKSQNIGAELIKRLVLEE
jgi:imidazole glycerol-phosphate synthase subunit HisH